MNVVINCDKFKEEIEVLKIALAKFTLGKNNLDIILDKQRCVFDKVGLGHNPENQQKMYKNFFALFKSTTKIQIKPNVSLIPEIRLKTSN